MIQVYITNAYRAYRIADHYRARGVFVALGGLHVTSLPDEAAPHADAIFSARASRRSRSSSPTSAPAGRARVYRSTSGRTLERVPPIRRDLIDRRRYLVPNSIVVTRGCPQHCDFCYKDAFFAGGRSFYTQRVDDALAEIARLPGRHLYFLDDHLLGDPRFAATLFDGMRGHGPALPGRRDGRFDPARRPDRARRRGRAAQPVRRLRDARRRATCARSNKRQNLGRDYTAVAARLHDLGIMINGSFVFGMDDDDGDVFQRTVDWAIDARHHDRDVPHPDAVSRHGAVRAHGGAGPDH